MISPRDIAVYLHSAIYALHYITLHVRRAKKLKKNSYSDVYCIDCHHFLKNPFTSRRDFQIPK